MAEFKMEIEDEILDDYLDFCAQMNIDGFEIIQRFMKALAQGGGAILEIPLHMSPASMELMIKEMESRAESNEDSKEVIDSLMSKYLN